MTTPVLPDTVKIGDSGDIASFALYTDKTKTVSIGRRVFSSVVAADTVASASSDTRAIVNLITCTYDLSGMLTLTEQTRVRVDTVGVLTPVSSDIVYSSGTRLTLTR